MHQQEEPRTGPESNDFSGEWGAVTKETHQVRAFAQAPSAESPTPGNANTFSLGALAAMLVCAAAFLGIGASAASAAPEAQPGWAHQRTFGEVNANGFEPTPNPLAVDGGGNIFGLVSSSGYTNGYRPDGSFLGQYPFTAEVQNLAADPSEDVIYIDNVFGGPVSRWVSDGEPTPTYTLDPGFSVPGAAGLAVDPSSNDLLVADPGAEAVLRYDTTGTLIDTISTSVSPFWIAAAPDGSIYIAPDGGSDVIHLSGAGAVLGTISGVGSLQGLAFDPANGVLIAAVGGTLKSFNAAGQPIGEGSGGSSVYGLATGSSGQLYELAGLVINEYIFATIPAAGAPIASDVQSTSVHLSAEVDPGAGPPVGSRAHFEYSADGGDSWTSTPDEGVERTGTDEPDTIEADIAGLSLNTDYLVRVKAANSLVSEVLSPVISFSTPEITPLVETGVASDLSETSAVLHGTVNPAGLQTGYHFEYGTTTAYGSRIPVSAEAPAGNNRVPLSVSRLITGLQPGVTYHYRLVAENAIGATAGEDRTFTTLTPADLFPQRAYEQVTPVDKEGAQLVSDFHGQAAPNGSAIAVTTSQAPRSAESSLMLQNHVSRRGADGWLDWTPADAPQDAVPGLNEASTAAISADFEHALVISNRVLATGGIAGGGNLYVKDLLTGDYTFVAGAPGSGAWSAMTGIQANERIFLAGAPDFSWIVFWGFPAFLPEASAPAIYRWTRATGDLKIESLLPGEIVPPFEAVGPDTYKRELTAVSSDGSVLAFGLLSGVYRRENGETKPVSASQVPGDPAGTEAQPGEFEGMTPDGRYVLFSSAAQLTEDAPESSSPADSAYKLYRYDALTNELEFLTMTGYPGSGYKVHGFGDDGQTIYADDPLGERTVVWHAGQLRTVTGERFPLFERGKETAVSSNGRYLIWVNNDGVARLYDAIADEVSCISCSPGGGPNGDAHILSVGRGIGNRETQAVIDDGTVFFDTPNRLLSADHNGAKDVYAYRDGRLNLISPGNADFDAFFVDASEDGRDVYFQTGQGLVGQDTDGEGDVYDARVGGGFASQNPPPPPGSCSGAECAQAGGQPTASPPVSTAGAANPAIPQKKKHKKHKHKTKKHKKKGQKNKRQSSRSANHSRNLGK